MSVVVGTAVMLSKHEVRGGRFHGKPHCLAASAEHVPTWEWLTPPGSGTVFELACCGSGCWGAVGKWWRRRPFGGQGVQGHQTTNHTRCCPPHPGLEQVLLPPPCQVICASRPLGFPHTGKGRWLRRDHARQQHSP